MNELALLRLVAQRIAGPGLATAAEAVGWLTAAQAQDFPGALTSIALRTTDRTRAGVEAALSAGEVVRSWPLRGTLHLVLAGELARRYFRGHGPATAKDLARWANLTLADVRAGLALARPQLAAMDVDGVEYLLDPRTPELLATWRRQAGGVFLLPGFDELVLGYADRTATVPAAYADRLVPGGNGVFRATVVSAGQAVGTWKRASKGTDRSVAAAPFESFPARVATAIPKVYQEMP